MNKTRCERLRRLWPGVVGLLLVVVFPHASGAESDKTGQPQAEQYRRFLEQNLTAISREGQAVRIQARADGKVGKYEPRRHQWTTSFVVEKGDSFFQRNHHARVEFTVQDIGADGVTIKARSLVMPREGSNRTDNNSSTFMLPYKERASER